MSLGMDRLNGATRSMTQAFTSAQDSMATSLRRISTGKRFERASEDLVSYTRLVSIDADRSRFQAAKADLTEARINVSTAIGMADNIMDDLREAKELFANGQDNAASQIMDGIADKITAEIGENVWYRTDWGSVKTVAGEGGVSLDFTEFGKVGEDDKLANLATAASEAEVDEAIEGMQAYIGSLQGLEFQLSSQERMADVAIDNTTAMSSTLTKIDEAAEMANVIDQDIRQQAAMSMMAQANMSRRSVTMLYR
ncbi:flagellin [Chitinispirillales bacterium ANBcel5]|uniref:flagellin n=1 Tax=Cellulosispirillum alkaliphilum TaxID=3039283 RepID=UPI002A54C1B4|nr:flagellin [Chitinispirillales bacterium ANBcel5]